MEPWYKVATPRREVREGRSFNPDEFAIALDRCGWMIVQQPQFGDRRWFMNYPSDACPEWADNDVPGEPLTPRPRLRVIDGGKASVERSKPRS